jgi:ubiquinol-cytochrome c reductase cytochrome c subunit
MSALVFAAALGSHSPFGGAVSSGAAFGGAPKAGGKELYTQYCSSCHGVDLRGGTNAPSLIGAGAADVDFWVSTGRMPAAVPWLQVGHRGEQPYLSPVEESLIVRYVAAVSPGPPIPLVITGGDPERGRALFQQNCQHCHGVAADGASIGGSTWAPSLAHATVTQLAEAIRVGPGEMPQFGERQIDRRDLDDIATYVSSKRGSTNFSGLPIVAGGAVPEGLYGWIAAGMLSFFGYGFWALDRKAPKGPADGS